MCAKAPGPDALILIVPGPAGAVAILPDDLVARSDDELLAFIAGRLTEQ